MSHSGRQMTGFVWVEPDAIEDDADLASWVGFALAAVAQRPPAKPTARKSRKTTRLKD
jgi:hypothetical protein